MAGLTRQTSLALQPVRRAGVHVFAWGRGDLGQLGVSVAAEDSVTSPTLLATLATADVVHITGGPYNTAFLTAEGELFTCGSNDSGELGVKGALGGSGGGVVRVSALEMYKITHVTYGQGHALAVTDKGVCLSWGAGEWGQLGLGAEVESQPYPKIVKSFKSTRLARVSAGACHSVGLTSSGHVMTWGQGTFGALGHGNEDNCMVPKQVQTLWHVGVVQVACGENHSVALSADGKVYAWGRGKYGALGCGDFKNSPLPQLIRALKGMPIVQVVCGGNHTLALAANGLVFSWGANSWGQLGLGTTDNTCSPNVVQGALEGQRVVQVAAGLRHSVALTSLNQVFVWGCGESGQLGGGQCVVAQLSPVPLPHTALPAMPVLFVAAGGDHTLAVLKDPGPGEQVVVGPVPPSLLPTALNRVPHGSGMMPLPLPQLLQLTQAAAAELGTHALPPIPGSPSHRSPAGTATSAAGAAATQSPNTGSPVAGSPSVGSPVITRNSSGTGAVGPAVAALVYAVEDVFTSPGFLAAGFALPQPAAPNSQLPSVSNRPALPAPGQTASVSGAAGSDNSQLKEVVEEAMRKQGVTPHSLDVDAISNLYQALLRLYSTEVVAALGSACATLLDNLDKVLHITLDAAKAASPSKAPGATSFKSSAVALPEQLLPTTAVLPALLILLQNPLNSQPLTLGAMGHSAPASLWSRLVTCWGHLPAEGQRILAHWVAGLPPEVFGGRVLRSLQQHIARCGDRGGQVARAELLSACQVMIQLYEAHTALEEATCTWGNTALLGSTPGDPAPPPILQPLPLTEWNNRALSESANLREEYMLYIQAQERFKNAQGVPMIASLCQMPIVLTPEAKSRILQGEAALQKQVHMQNSALSAYLQGIHPGAVAFLDVHVRRDNVLQDALTQILHRPEDLKKPLRVTFIGPGGAPEEGLDEGGVSREFFQLLVAEIFKPDYGMWVWSEETRTFWFNSLGQGLELEYRLVGAVLGLAIYNNIILDVHFPTVMYKKLMGRSPGWRDLCEAQPMLAKGLAALLQFDGDVENTFCRTFEVEYDYFGETRRKELIPNGSNVPVTASNRQQYVELYTKWVLEGSIESQFKAFLEGFHSVCGGPALALLSPPELELLVAGLPHLDFNALEAGARYEGGYSATTPVVRWFWETIHGMTLEQKKRFLSFTTGCDRAPVGGLGKLVLTIQRSGPDSDRLPTAHTCFNILLIPEYASQAKVRDSLLTAIENAQGFGLQ